MSKNKVIKLALNNMSQDSSSNNSGNGDSYKSLAVILKELGLPSFIIVVVTGIFLIFASPSQKEEFIDRFILLKNISSDPFPYTLIVVVLVLIIAIGGYYQQKSVKFLKEENKRLGVEKSELQKKLLKKNLQSSK